MYAITRVFLIIALLLGSAACQRDEAKKLETPNINWKSLEFTCTHEKNRVPKFDQETDQWFKTARAYEKSGNESLFPEMVRLYEKAAERNHYKAMNNLAVIYAFGEGAEQDMGRALSLVERMMQQNIGMGYYKMGAFIEQGIGVEQDQMAALAYYRRAADLGSPQGQYAVGKKLLSIHKDAPEPARVRAVAIQMLECALAQGEAKAGDRLGWHFAEGTGDASRGLAYFQRAAALGNMDSLYVLYTAFKDGDWGTNIDPARAACYYKLLEEVRADNKKTFPNIDRICPLPPKPLPPRS